MYILVKPMANLLYRWNRHYLQHCGKCNGSRGSIASHHCYFGDGLCLDFCEEKKETWSAIYIHTKIIMNYTMVKWSQNLILHPSSVFPGRRASTIVSNPAYGCGTISPQEHDPDVIYEQIGMYNNYATLQSYNKWDQWPAI